jgi:hypothetical protein
MDIMHAIKLVLLLILAASLYSQTAHTTNKGIPKRDRMIRDTNIKLADHRDDNDICSDEQRISASIGGLASRKSSVARRAAANLFKAYNQCVDKSAITRFLNKKLEELCSGESEGLARDDYSQLQKLTSLLSRLKESSSLELLTSCIDKTSRVTGMSREHFPAQKALVEYDEVAVPILAKQLKSAPISNRCTFGSILLEIGSKEAFYALKDAFNSESNLEVRLCLRRFIDRQTLHVGFR